LQTRGEASEDQENALTLLCDELPDPDQDLFPEEFPRFQEFPVEIRLKIWLLTFPEPRKVYLGVYEYYSSRPDAYDGEWWDYHRKNHPLPVALWINAESRAETLRHYCVFYPEEFFPASHKKHFKPLCFNPSEDSFDIIYLDIFPYEYETLPQLPLLSFEDHLSALSAQHPSCMRKIHELRIQQVHYNMTEGYSVYDLFNSDAPAGSLIVEAEPHFYSAFIFNFPALRRIIWGQDSFTYDDLLWRSDLVNALRAFLEKNKERFEDGRAPEVIALPDDDDDEDWFST